MSEKDGYFTLSFVMGEALPAAQMLESAQKVLQETVTDFKLQKAKNEFDFVMRWFAHVYVRDPSRFMLEGASDTARVGSRGNLVRLGWVISCPEGHCHRAAAQVALALARTAPRSLAAMFAGGSMNSPT